MSKGPIYEVELLDTLPLGTGTMRQALPSRSDLEDVREVSERTVAGYEVLLAHYYRQQAEIEQLRAALEPFAAVAKVIPDNWPGQCRLRVDWRWSPGGQLEYFSYHGIEDKVSAVLPTIGQWREAATAAGSTP